MENELFPCGTNVTMILAKIPGIITAQCIRFGYIEYEVSYFSDGIHYQVWLHESEFHTLRSKQIGF
jgi:hypothetical protein